MGTYKNDLLLLNPHYNEPHPKQDFTFYDGKLNVEVWSDGTETHARVTHVDTGDELGDGVSRRRKGEKRNELAGVALAVSRALAAAAEAYREQAEKLIS